jgi:hypothetical protein
LHFKDDGNERIDEEKPKAISLESALSEIKNFPTLGEYNNNHMVFLNEKNEAIHFTRLETDLWLLDVPNTGEDEISLNDDSLSTENVTEIVKTFFTESEGLKELRKRLIITDQIKDILQFEMRTKKKITDPAVITSRLGFERQEAERCLKLLEQPLEYEQREVESLKLRARGAFKKFIDPNLHDLIVNLGMDFYTAKKVGRYLKDIGWINAFPRIPPDAEAK